MGYLIPVWNLEVLKLPFKQLYSDFTPVQILKKSKFH